MDAVFPSKSSNLAMLAEIGGELWYIDTPVLSDSRDGTALPRECGGGDPPTKSSGGRGVQTIPSPLPSFTALAPQATPLEIFGASPNLVLRPLDPDAILTADYKCASISMDRTS